MAVRASASTVAPPEASTMAAGWDAGGVAPNSENPFPIWSSLASTPVRLPIVQRFTAVDIVPTPKAIALLWVTDPPSDTPSSTAADPCIAIDLFPAFALWPTETQLGPLAVAPGPTAVASVVFVVTRLPLPTATEFVAPEDTRASFPKALEPPPSANELTPKRSLSVQLPGEERVPVTVWFPRT